MPRPTLPERHAAENLAAFRSEWSAFAAAVDAVLSPAGARLSGAAAVTDGWRYDMSTALDHPLVADYLQELDSALAGLPPKTAGELSEQLRAHLLDALPDEPSDDAVRDAPAALGPASMIAVAAAPSPGQAAQAQNGALAMVPPLLRMWSLPGPSLMARAMPVWPLASAAADAR